MITKVGTKAAVGAGKALTKRLEKKQEETIASPVTERKPVDAGVLPTTTVKVRRVNKAPKTPGSRQAGRGRTYTRTTFG